MRMMQEITFLLQKHYIQKRFCCPSFGIGLEQNRRSVTLLFAVLDRMERCFISYTHVKPSGHEYSDTYTGNGRDRAHS